MFTVYVLYNVHVYSPVYTQYTNRFLPPSIAWPVICEAVLVKGFDDVGVVDQQQDEAGGGVQQQLDIAVANQQQM